MQTFIPSQEIQNLNCISASEHEEEIQIVNRYFSSLDLNPNLPKEFLQLIKDFYISTHPIYGDPYTWDYFDLKSINIIDSSFDFTNAPQDLKSYQEDQDFHATQFIFHPHIEDDINIFTESQITYNNNIRNLKREWENFFSSPELESNLIFDINKDNQTLIIYLICY